MLDLVLKIVAAVLFALAGLRFGQSDRLIAFGLLAWVLTAII